MEKVYSFQLTIKTCISGHRIDLENRLKSVKETIM